MIGDAFGQLFPVVAPILILVAVGFVWQKSGRHFDNEAVTPLIVTIGTPLLVMDALTGITLDPAAVTEMLLASLLAYLGFIVVGLAAVLPARLPVRSYLPPLMLPNAGNMGLPICLFAFGPDGLGLATAFFTMHIIFQFTVGLSLASGATTPLPLLKTPVTYAVLLALAFLFGDIEVPLWLANTLDLGGGLTIPLMLITLGVALGRLPVNRVWRALWLSAARIGGGLLVGVLVAEALGLDGIARGVLIIQCAMPAAVYNYVFADAFNRDPEDVAGLVMMSTVVSFVTLPGVLLFGLAQAGV